MESVQIRRFSPADEQGVIDVILPIQRDEFGISISIDDQPDLRNVASFYQSGRGDFLVAEVAGVIVGTIGMKDIGAGRAALRKMFVASHYRGRPYNVANNLLESLIKLAINRGLQHIFLGTTEKFVAAHRFYEKNGFCQITADALPPEFPRMAVDTRFYVLNLA